MQQHKPSLRNKRLLTTDIEGGQRIFAFNQKTGSHCDKGQTRKGLHVEKLQVVNSNWLIVLDSRGSVQIQEDILGNFKLGGPGRLLQQCVYEAIPPHVSSGN